MNNKNFDYTFDEEKGVLTLEGELTLNTLADEWESISRKMCSLTADKVTIHGKDVRVCNASGIAFLVDLKEKCQAASFEGFDEKVMRYVEPQKKDDKDKAAPKRSARGRIVELGHSITYIFNDIKHLISFVGELTVRLLSACLKPWTIRFKDMIEIIYSAGVDAVGIVSLIGFLMGLIMAFQAAIPMRQFGADIFIADLVGLSLVRELAALMTAIVLAGRSGSAFAAEIGTMKVNEEINALNTMGLNPVRFLVTSRVLGVVLVMPLLTLFGMGAGLVGGAIVMKSLGYPLVTYVNQISNAVRLVDFTGGMVKSFVFGLLVAAVGCLRGLETGTGAQAVGRSATRAVVSGIILIVIADGLFAVVYYYLGI